MQRTNINANGNDAKKSKAYNEPPPKRQKRQQCSIYRMFCKGKCSFKNKKGTEKRSNNGKMNSNFTVQDHVHLMQTMMGYAEMLNLSWATR
jgi:hypothetical protein